MCGELEPKRLSAEALRIVTERYEASLGQHRTVADNDRLYLLQHIAWQEQQLEKARLAMELADSLVAAIQSGGWLEGLTGTMSDEVCERADAYEAYRAAKAAAHGPTEPPTDLQGG